MICLNNMRGTFFRVFFRLFWIKIKTTISFKGVDDMSQQYAPIFFLIIYPLNQIKTTIWLFSRWYVLTICAKLFLDYLSLFWIKIKTTICLFNGRKSQRYARNFKYQTLKVFIGWTRLKYMGGTSATAVALSSLL